jgi:large subunit ribosomal protein L22
MAEQKYAFTNFNKETMAKASVQNATVSTKKSIEVSSFIRGMDVKKAKNVLNRVLLMKDSVPYKRFNQELAHNQRGPGGYPINVVKEVLKLIESAESNAKAKGLNVDNLKIVHICSNKGPKAWHYGRQRRRLMKRTHIELVLAEGEAKTKAVAKPKTTTKKSESTAASKPAKKEASTIGGSE